MGATRPACRTRLGRKLSAGQLEPTGSGSQSCAQATSREREFAWVARNSKIRKVFAGTAEGIGCSGCCLAYRYAMHSQGHSFLKCYETFLTNIGSAVTTLPPSDASCPWTGQCLFLNKLPLTGLMVAAGCGGGVWSPLPPSVGPGAEAAAPWGQLGAEPWDWQGSAVLTGCRRPHA